jgi:hypothetical protein
MATALPGGSRALPLAGPLAALMKDQLAEGLVGSLQPAGITLQLSDWAPAQVSGIGDQAAAYSFRFRASASPPSDGASLGGQFPPQGVGAFVLFMRGDVLSALMAFYAEGQASDDWRHYASLVDARLQTAAASGR